MQVQTENLGHVHDRIEACMHCHQECMEAFQYCLQRGGEYVDPHHIKQLQTCIEICWASARFMMLQSPYQHMLTEICAQVCLVCAKSCSEFRDDALNECVRACMDCAEACAH